MSARQIVEVACECPYVEYEQHYSYSRGVLRRTIVCRHPENTGCLCVLDAEEVAECEFCPTDENEEKKTVHIDVKRR